MIESASDFCFSALRLGDKYSTEYLVSWSAWRALVEVFGDRSPIHIDAEYARERGFADVVAHGAVLNGFVSHFIGMKFPGRRALLLSVELRYLKPVHVHDRLSLEGEIVQLVPSQQVALMRLKFAHLVDARVVARGRAMVKVADV